ncbi:type II secretion system protein H [Legionella massiliensis]|uniref:Type II secretion system protein H n=1 Tax=Legionella massiliensis TaxID=1034943 RepID=A0A078L1R7_9GAMM|nr:GspH/FimT family protein [Legionella massiliensis]CDZ79171.1 type II secretion system protein H [Legionella massiliensis]CEE14909.1 Type II transport protein GspH [Legionella massiliensis]
MNLHRSPAHRKRGFSLVELLLSILLIGILLAFSTPFGLDLYRKNQLEIVKDELAALINFARATAILQGKPLVLAPLPGGLDWSKGAILFADNKTHQYSENIKPIHLWQWHHKGLQLSWQGLHSVNYLIFSADPNHSASSGHFTIQNDKGASTQLTLNRLGRVRR